MIDQIRAQAKELLESGQVSCVIGYEAATDSGTRPAFIYEPGDVERLVWNRECYANLTLCPAKQAVQMARNSIHCSKSPANFPHGNGRQDMVHMVNKICSRMSAADWQAGSWSDEVR